MNGEIVKSESVNLSIPSSPAMIDAYAEKLTDVMHMEDIENVISAFKDQDELLSKAKEYGELRARYAALEAATYKKVVDKGWANALGTKCSNRRRAAEWLSENPNEYVTCINEILNNGETIITFYKKRLGNEVKKHYCRRIVERNEDVIKEYKKYGSVSLGGYSWSSMDDLEKYPFQSERILDDYLDMVGDDRYDLAGEHTYEDFSSDYLLTSDLGISRNVLKGPEGEKNVRFIRSMAEMANDNLRIKLRKEGAVGVGEGRYVNPETHQEEMYKAISIRKRNVAACVIRLKQLCDDLQLDFIKEVNSAIRKTKLPVRVLSDADDV